MRISFPGRAGDILWAMSVVKQIAAVHGPVDLTIAGEFASMIPLLKQQPYLQSVTANPAWGLSPEQAWMPPAGTVDMVHLGYRDWPTLPLPCYVELMFRRHYPELAREVESIKLEEPWLTVNNGWTESDSIAAGFTEAWFELKLGLIVALDMHPTLLTPPGSRWTAETKRAYESVWVCPCDWGFAAEYINAAEIFLGDCSALHVLAAGLGKQVILVEPMEARWNDIFYPLGKAGRIRLVVGLDHQPTFDARHVADALREALHG